MCEATDSGASRAIWAIIYDLSGNGRDDYLAWFHDVHIPDKLARPGYLWAAHYECLTSQGAPASSLGEGGRGKADESIGYIALFGATDTSVFLNPSPAQIKPRQTELTRNMMGRRIGQRAFIAAEEWRREAANNAGRRAHPAIELICCDTEGGDENFGAWCVQEQAPALASRPGFGITTKLLAATGPAKHLVLSEFAEMDRQEITASTSAPTEWAERTSRQRRDLDGSPFMARRICPAVANR